MNETTSGMDVKGTAKAMTTHLTGALSGAKDLFKNTFSNTEEGKTNLIVSIIVGVCLMVIGFFIMYQRYLNNLQQSTCDYMNTLYSKTNSFISNFDSSNSNYQYHFCDYYVKTAFNACSGGTYTNQFVDTCHLKTLLKQGVRAFDFEIYNIGDIPVICTSADYSDTNYYYKDTFNSVPFQDALSVLIMNGLNTIDNVAICPNPKDPMIIHLRIKSTNKAVYDSLGQILKNNQPYLLSESYHYSLNKLFGTSISTFCGKVIVAVYCDNSILSTSNLDEFVNIKSGTENMRLLSNYDVEYTPDYSELQRFNQQNYSMVIPDTGSNPTNPNFLFAMQAGCQLIAMRFQFVDSYLETEIAMFDKNNSAFLLKDASLRAQYDYVDPPTIQKESNSYETRQVDGGFYQLLL